MVRTMLMVLIVGTCFQVATAEEVTTKKPVLAQPAKHDWLVSHPTIQELVTRTNAHRAQMGRGPVRLNADMALAAQRHAQWMADTGAYQHSGLPYMEVIFSGPRSAADSVQGWIASPAHHSILLSGSEVGFGYMIRNGQTYWVGVFR